VDRDDDQALVQSCKVGDRDAFVALVNRYQRPIFNAAFRVVGNRDDANDVTQVVFLRVVEKIEEYDARYKFFSWIYRIAVNESIDLVRHRSHSEPLEGDVDEIDGNVAGPESQYEERQTEKKVQAALMSLKADDRVVITLRHFSECSYREIADILGLEEKTVKSRLFDARKRMAALLQDL
jgi:RNA polymerase sigma-70 factor, ECF subfamily